MIGLGDNIGSGFPTILNVWGEEQWRKPDLSQNIDLHQVELKLWMISLMPPECTEYLRKLFGIAYEHLDKNSQIILGTAYLEHGVTNVRMQSMLELHSIEISHILSELVDKNMLIADRKGRWTSYKLNTNYKITSEQLCFSDIPAKRIGLKNETDRLIYDYICTNGFITVHQVLDITKVTTLQGANVALGRLLRENLIIKVRRGRHFIYQLNDFK